MSDTMLNAVIRMPYEMAMASETSRIQFYNRAKSLLVDRAADKARIAELESLAERLKQEAQVHAQEARTANGTIAEIYRVASGGKGEPGNWNGAEPVRKRIAELEREAKTEQQLQRAAELLPEGYELQVCVEKDAGWIELTDAQGRGVEDNYSDGETLGDMIEGAIDAALAQQGKEGGE